MYVDTSTGQTSLCRGRGIRGGGRGGGRRGGHMGEVVAALPGFVFIDISCGLQC